MTQFARLVIPSALVSCNQNKCVKCAKLYWGSKASWKIYMFILTLSVKVVWSQICNCVQQLFSSVFSRSEICPIREICIYKVKNQRLLMHIILIFFAERLDIKESNGHVWIWPYTCFAKPWYWYSVWKCNQLELNRLVFCSADFQIPSLSDFPLPDSFVTLPLFLLWFTPNLLKIFLKKMQVFII